MPKKEKIEEMFDSIAGDYDRLNHIMSLDIDRRWRRKAIRKIVDAPGLEILDLACGTGDFSIAQARSMVKDYPGDKGHVTGVDLSDGMLAVMQEKVGKLSLGDVISSEKGDGENLRFSDGTFDRVSIAFGIRNFEDREKGLREMRRVLKQDGRLVILELSIPEKKLIRGLYDFYFLKILPLIGGGVSGEKGAYRYLPASVVKFPRKKEFMATMEACGFRNVTHKAFTFGVCRMYIATK